MKTIREIYARAVILQCLTDRICMETGLGKNYRSGFVLRHDVNQIRNWLEKKGFYPYLTEEEKLFFEMPVYSKEYTPKIYAKDVQCKAMDILLWVLNLIDEIPDLEEMRIGDYHKLLNVSPNNDPEREVSNLRLRDESEIKLQADISFLWDWRMNHVDAKATKGAGHNITGMIREQFGDRYNEALNHIRLYTPRTSRGSDDFVAWNLVVREQYKWQLDLMRSVTYWYDHAFAWIYGDVAWDDVTIS